MNKLTLVVPFAVATVFAGANDAHALQWVTANAPTCNITCHLLGMSAVVSGSYVDGSRFYVCAGNAHGEGFRGGYNLYSNACWVGWGGSETSVSPYSCLCQ